MANEFTWSDDQLRVLEASGNMLVSASAGSGKTAVMIEKIRRLLVRGESLKNMVVCTFTTAAAADMKYKLAKALADPQTRAEMDPRHRQRETEYLPQAAITTIDGICARLVRSYFYRTDADPAFEVLSDGEKNVLQAECLSDVLEHADGERFALLYDALLADRTDDRIRAFVRNLYEFSEIQPDPDGWLNDCLRIYDDPQAVADALQQMLRAERTALAAEADALRIDTVQAAFTRNIAACEGLTDWLNRLADRPKPTGRIPDWAQPLHERYKDLAGRIEKFLDKEDAWNAAPDAVAARPEAEVLVQLTRDFRAEYAAVKRKRGKLDFSDLEHYALEILMSDAAEAIQAGVRYMFVDEYQDTNPLQEEILNLLSARADLFEVGDLKQSIYAFRLCDPRIFLHKYRAYAAGRGGQAYLLNANFRSSQSVVAGVNAVFGRAMTEAFGGVNYTETPLTCTRNKQGRLRLKLIEGTRTETYPAVYSPRADKGGVGKKYAMAKEIADDISKLLYRVPDKDDEKQQPVRPSEIAVISRSRSQTLAELYDILRARKIPAAYTVKSRACDNPAVRPVVNMLRLIDNRDNDVMLAACLQSRFGGMTESEWNALSAAEKKDLGGPGGLTEENLADVRRACPTAETFADAVAAYAGTLRPKLDAFLARLDRYEKLAAERPAEEVAGILVSESEYFEYLYSLENGETLAADLSAFLAMPAAAGTISDLLEYTDSTEETGAAAGDCVQLMTAHASKGLEFKYVFLADADRKFRLDDVQGPVLFDSEYGLAVQQFDYDAHQTIPTKLCLLTAARKKQRMLEEELRILYVAMTRAQDELYIYGHTGGRAETSGYMPWLTAALQSEPAEGGDDIVLPRTTHISYKPNATLQAAIERNLSACITRRQEREQNPSVVQKTAVTALAEQEDEADGRVYECAHTDSERAAAVGTAYHLMMEHIDFYADFDAEWDKLRQRFPEAAAMCDPERIRLAQRCMAEFAAGKTQYREQPFILDDKGTLVQGVIDLLLVDGDEAVIVDYKTTRSRDLDTPAYRFQTGMYARATERLLKLRVRAVYLYSFFMDKPVLMDKNRISDKKQR